MRPTPSRTASRGERRSSRPFRSARFVDGGAQNIGFARSTDAGRTWRSGILPQLTGASRPRGAFQRASDPVVAYDDAHGLWLISTLGITATGTAVLVSSSADGLHWSAPVTAIQKPDLPNSIALDKEWIACDNGASSPFRGHCYVSYSDIERRGARHPDVGRRREDLVGRSRRPGPRRSARHPGAVRTRAAAGRTSRRNARGSDLRRRARPPFARPTAAPRSRRERRIAAATFSRVPGLRAAPLPSAEVGADGTVFLAWPDCAPRAGLLGERHRLLEVPHRGELASAGENPARPREPRDRRDRGRPGTRGPRRGHLLHRVRPQARRPPRLVPRRRRHLVSPVRLSPERMPYRRIAEAGGAMVGDYISTSFAGNRAVSVFTLAQSRLRGRYRQATYASSIAVP